MKDRSESPLSHVGPDGSARMVDVSDKADSSRSATASGYVSMDATTLEAIRSSSLKKGDVLAIARIAGIMAAKRTSDLIPLCHPISLTDVGVSVEMDSTLPGIRVSATARCMGKTGVEMEALTAASVALLTVYDMAKAVDRAMVIGDLRLEQKSGGASGAFSRVDGV